MTLAGATRIWDEGAHNAFTDLARWRDRWFCVFREGDDHVGGDGRIRVLVSVNGARWSSAALIEEPGVDLRDPRLSVTPDDRLMLVAGGSVYDGDRFVHRQPRVLFSTDGSHWTVPARILDEGDWLWRVTWHEGRAYGVTYRTLPEEWTATLVSSADGVAFEPITTFVADGWPNETTLRFLPNGEMVALLRRDRGDCLAWLGRSRAPFTTWDWRPTSHRFGGPNFIQLPNGALWAGGRCYGPASSDGTRAITTAVGPLTLDGRYAPDVVLPSGGDTGYPGMVWHDGMLWVSYYASHEGKASIYLARLSTA